MAQAQKFLDEKVKKDSSELVVGGKNLTGPLKIENFTKLKKLYCPTNKITSLEITNCPNLETITCRDNQLTKLDIKKCPSLRIIDCSNNPLTNLNLKELTKLNELDISETNLDASILVSLPENLEKIICLNKKNRKCQSIIKELKGQCEDPVRGIYNFKKWKEANKQLIEQINQQNQHQELLNLESSNPSQVLQNFRHKLEIYFPNQLLSAGELVEKVGQKIENLEQQITDLEKQVETQTQTYQQLEKQNTTNFQTQITQLQGEKTAFSNQINANQAEIQKLHQEKEELITQKQILESSLETLKQTNENEKITLNQQITSLENAKLAAEKELNQQIVELKQKVENLITTFTKEKKAWEKEKLAHQQAQSELSNLKSEKADKEQHLQSQITALQAQNSNLTLAAEENNKILTEKLQDLQKTIQEQKNANSFYQQRMNELTVANQQLTQEISNLTNNPTTPEILHARQQLEFQLKEAIANQQGIREELSKKEGYLECLLTFGKNENLGTKQKLQQEISTLKEKLTHTEQAKSEIEKQLVETKEKLAESRGKLAAKEEEITRLDERLKNTSQPSSSQNQEENKLVSYAKKLQTIQEDFNLFFSGWNKLSLDQQDKLIAGLEVTKKDTRVKWMSENDVFALTNRVNKAVTFVGGGLSTFGYPEVGGGITLVSSAIDTAVSELENSKKKVQERLIEFLQDFANLKRNYHNLKKISMELTLIDKNSALPENISKALVTFSQLVNKLQTNLNPYNSDISNAEQGINEAENKNFIQHLQENYIEIREVLNNLREELVKEGSQQLEAWVVISTENTPLLPR